MKLSIIDTEKTQIYDVNWVEINTPVGNMVIQPDHAPIIVELTKGQDLVFQLVTGEQRIVAIVQGVAHVTRLEVKILIPIAIV